MATIAEPAVIGLSMQDRQALLVDAVEHEARHGWRVQAQTPLQASLVKGKPTSHLLHLVLTLLTFGLWAIVWICLALFAGQKSKVLTVDDTGLVRVSR